ncbi:alpha/beta hydrolase [Acinetobacter towneri]|uniref:alpha/beta hydrolase n=1 Tax=Acinetobacter towneri TaxID=202956 RepID=UPI0014441992|nr:alpha/beta hydrolase [Acinetobacter towneri]
MQILNSSLKQRLHKGQGTAARFLNKLPDRAHEALAQALAYPYQYPDLDPFIKCMMAAQLKQGKVGFIGADPIQSRQQFDRQIASIASTPTAVKRVEEVRLNLPSGDIAARYYHPAPHKKLPLIVFYHGGGFVVGGLDSHDEFCRLMAVHANAQVLSVAYPLAPEASPQQIIQVCEEALAWAYQHRRQMKILKNRIAVAGDSAGGNIAAVVAQRSVHSTYAPEAQFLIYPALDFKSRHPSFFAYKDGLVLTEQDIDFVTHHYATQHQVALDDPIISPTFGKLKKLAPAFVVTAGHDVLHDEAEIYAHKLRQNQVTAKYVEYLDQAHGFINLSFVSSRAKKLSIEMCKNFRKFWDRPRH